jgi:hypothetical protein
MRLHLFRTCSMEMMSVLKAGIQDVWIGYRATPTTGGLAKWKWVDGSEDSYTNWARQKCFRVFTEPKTWHQAQHACEQWDRASSTVGLQDTYADGRSSLVSITSSEDAQFLSKLVSEARDQNPAKKHVLQQIYIGFNRRHNKDFVWSDRSGPFFVGRPMYLHLLPGFDGPDSAGFIDIMDSC